MACRLPLRVGSTPVMERNAPKGDDVATSEYMLPHWKEFSTRIDGALGAAFEDMAESDRFVIASGGVLADDDSWWKTYSESFDSYGEILRICRPFQ